MAEFDYWNDKPGWRDKIVVDSNSFMIYRQNEDDVAKFLKQMEEENPIVPNSSSPASIYLNDFGIKRFGEKVQFSTENTEVLASILSRDYTQCSIVKRIFERVRELGSEKASQAVIGCLVEARRAFPKARTIDEFISGMSDVLPIISEEYCNLANGESYVKDTRAFSFSVCNINLTLECIMNALNNSSHFSLILDKRVALVDHSMERVNEMIASNIPVKLILKPEDDSWIKHNAGECPSAHDFDVAAFDQEGANYLKKRYGITYFY